MTTVQEITQANNGVQAATTTATTDTDNGIMGKEDFLTLLVAQLQNQDPLNPDDPTEFTAQLAQFSSLEQLFNLNESMDNVADSVANSDRLSALGIIGKEVGYESSTFSFNGEAVDIGYKLDGDAASVKLLVQSKGTTVAVLDGTELTEGNHFITWDGLDQNGNQVATGDLTIVLQAKAVEGETLAATPLIKSEVTGVDLDGADGGLLITKSGEIDFRDILGVFENDTTTTDTEESDEEDDSSQSVAETLIDDLLEDTEEQIEETTAT